MQQEAKVLGVVPRDGNFKRHFEPDGILFAIVGEFSRVLEEKRMAFTQSDLTTEAGRFSALKAQGYIQALDFATNFIMELKDEPAGSTE